MAKLAHCGATFTRLPDGTVLIWYCNQPEVAQDVPDDLLDITSEDPTEFHNWLTYWGKEESK